MNYATGTQTIALRRWDTVLVCVGACILFTVGFWDQQFIGFETRFGVFAKEMLRHGPGFFPTTYGAPYPDYPATSTFFIYLLSLPFGEVNKLTAIIPTALFSSLTIALTYHFFKRFSLHWAYMTILLEISTITFLAEARSISLDQMVSFVTMASFYIAYMAAFENKQGYVRWLPLLFVIGFIIRGPLGLVIPCGIVCSVYWVNKDYLKAVKFGIASLALLIGLWSVLLYLANVSGGDQFVDDVIRMQVSGRIAADKNATTFYYFTNSIGNYAPIFPFFCIVALYIIANLKAFRLRNDFRLLYILIAWVLVIIVGLSIPQFKKARYILPMVPAMAALAAYPFYNSQDRALEILKYIFQTLLMLVPGCMYAVCLIASVYVKKHDIKLNINFMLILTILAFIQITALILFSSLSKQKSREISAMGLAALSIWLTNYMLIEPAELVYHDASTFVSHLEKVRADAPAPLVFYKVSKDSDAINYLANVDHDLDITFINDPLKLKELKQPYYLISEDKNIASLNCNNDCSGKLIYEHQFYSEMYNAYLFK